MKMQLNVGKFYAFTLFEVLALIVVMALLITAVVPGYKDLIRNTQAMAMTDRLAQSLRLAQSEAIKRGIPVTICPISSSFDPSIAFDENPENSEEWPCLNTTTWSAWKIFADPNFTGVENYSGGWPVISYVKNEVDNSIYSNRSGRITYDPMGFANINPTSTRTGWTWSSSYSSGEWGWSYSYSSTYSGAYYRIFTILPDGCSGTNARILEINQTGLISISSTNCP